MSDTLFFFLNEEREENQLAENANSEYYTQEYWQQYDADANEAAQNRIFFGF